MVPVASTPSISTRPLVGSSNPAMMLKMVLLPQPDGPIRFTKRPCGIDSVTGASAWKAPVGVLNVMLTSATHSFGAETDMRTLRSTVSRHGFPNPRETISQKPCQHPSPFACGHALWSKFQGCPPMAGNYSICTSFRQACPASGTSLRLYIRCLEDGRPTGDLGIHEARELRRGALVLGGQRSAQIGQPGLDSGVVQRLVERGRELVDDVPRRALGRENPGPDAHPIADAGLLRRRHVGQHRQALAGGDAVGLDRAGGNLRGDAHRLLAEEVDVAADQVIQRRAGAAIGHKTWLHAGR